MTNPIVEIKNVTKTIGKKTIIDNLSFNVYPGEVFGFLGPNGAGKTTTIRMMVGLMAITKGEILIEGKSIAKEFEAAITKVGGIVENPELYKFLTGYQNLIHYARMVDGVTKERIDEIIQLVGLNKRINDKVKTYSLGMRQRLGVAQALLNKPSLLILDEPTNGLDPAGIREIREYLRKLAREEGIAVIVSSHLLSEMELMCDRIGIIQNGKLVDIKLVNEFLSEEGSIAVLYSVEPMSEAKKILEETLNGQKPTEKAKGLEIIVEREQIPEITAKLVQEGIKIYGIKETSKTLEDKFLELTGGNEIA